MINENGLPGQKYKAGLLVTPAGIRTDITCSHVFM